MANVRISQLCAMQLSDIVSTDLVHFIVADMQDDKNPQNYKVSLSTVNASTNNRIDEISTDLVELSTANSDSFGSIRGLSAEVGKISSDLTARDDSLSNDIGEVQRSVESLSNDLLDKVDTDKISGIIQRQLQDSLDSIESSFGQISAIDQIEKEMHGYSISTMQPVFTEDGNVLTGEDGETQQVSTILSYRGIIGEDDKNTTTLLSLDYLADELIDHVFSSQLSDLDPDSDVEVQDLDATSSEGEDSEGEDSEESSQISSLEEPDPKIQLADAGHLCCLYTCLSGSMTRIKDLESVVVGLFDQIKNLTTQLVNLSSQLSDSLSSQLSDDLSGQLSDGLSGDDQPTVDPEPDESGVEDADEEETGESGEEDS